MFVPIPMQVVHSPRPERIPVANLCLIAVNFLAFLLLKPANWCVGPGTGLVSLLSYGFVHSGVSHLLFNMWFLWVIGSAVNRRIGNAYFLAAYLGTIVFMGILARAISPNYLLGSSGAIFAVMAISALLLPGSRVLVHYLAFFPLTILMCLIRRPNFGLFWVIRWGSAELAMLFLILLFTVLELCGLWWWGLNWTNLGHLFGLVCGVGIVLLMPTQVTMGHSPKAI